MPTKPKKAKNKEPETNIGAFALSILKTQYSETRAHLDGAISGADVEDLHRMRVSVRRMRAALRLFEDVLPKGWAAVREQYGRLGEVLGHARDRDVLQERIRLLSPKLPIKFVEDLWLAEEALNAARKRIRAEMMLELESIWFEKFCRQTETLLKRTPPVSPEAAEPVSSALADRVKERRSRFSKAAKKLDGSSSPEERHQVRILAKQYRYALEFGEPVLGSKSASLAKKLAKLQDGLGAQQDAKVGVSVLEELAAAKPVLAQVVQELTRLFEKMALKEGKSAARMLEKLLD